MSEKVFLPLIVIFSVLLFGSIEAWAFGAIGIVVVIYFNLWLRGQEVKIPESFVQRVFYTGILGFFIYCLLQIMPMPFGVLKRLSPPTYALLSTLSLEKVYGSISFYPFVSMNEILKLAVYTMMFFISVYVARRREDVRRILIVIVVFTCLLSLFAIIQKATWNGKIYWFRELSQGGNPFGPFVNRNHFAGFVGMVIPVGLGLAIETRRIEKRFLVIFLTMVAALGLFYSLSRGGIMSFFTAMGAFISLSAIKGIKKRSTVYIIIFFTLLIFYLLYLGMTPIIERFARGGLTDEERLKIWLATMKAISDFPVFGVGLGVFNYIIPMYYPDPLQKNIHYAHNDYLQVLLETGIIGGFLIFITISALAIMIIRSLLVQRIPDYIYIGLISSLVYIAVHSIFDFNLHMPSNAILLSLVVGILYGMTINILKRRRSNYLHDRVY